MTDGIFQNIATDWTPHSVHLYLPSTGRAVHSEGGTPDTERWILGVGNGQLADRGRRRLQPPRGRGPPRHALHDVQVL